MMSTQPRNRPGWNLLPIAQRAHPRIGKLLVVSPNRSDFLSLFDELMKSQRSEPLAEVVEHCWELAG